MCGTTKGMLAQNEDFVGVFDSMFWHAKIRITNKCNMKCRHCYAPFEAMPIDYPIDPNITEKLIMDPQIQYVHLQGGEPMLYPQLCRQIAELCRKHKKPVCLFTNGFWIKDYDTVKYVKKEIKPDFICISCNKYLEEQIDIYNIINQACEYFKDESCSIKLLSTAIIDSSKLDVMYKFCEAGGWPPYNPSWFPELESHFKYQFFKFMLPLCSGGRGINLKEDLPRIRWPKDFLACTFSFGLNPDGNLYGDCGATANRCYLGHINDFNLPATEIIKRINTLMIKDNRELNGFHEICQEKGWYCL